ncbi:hypothetical protein DL96DRAFT_1607594 [Flagelloscypha sp. PMI_526]|nr:hypothetical protein DL96DRAFT_1607594 [Flagelloscypha sp. PMI_526]
MRSTPRPTKPTLPTLPTVPALPPEIHAHIITYLFFDTNALKHCALTCSSLLRFAQAQLFHNMTVHLLGNEEDHEKMNYFLSFYEESRRMIIGFTKTLTILKTWDLRRCATPAVAVLLSHWADSSTLQHLRLVCNFIRPGWDAPRREGLIDDYVSDPSVASTILCLASGRSLDLDWNGIEDHFIYPLLSACGQIDSIRLHKCRLPSKIAQHGKKISPRFIRLCGINRIEPEISEVLLNGERCQTIILASGLKNEFVSMLLNQASTTLRHLKLKLYSSSHARTYGFSFLDLSPSIFASFPQLQTCTFGIDDTLSLVETVTWVCEAVSVIPHPILLSRIRLAIENSRDISLLSFMVPPLFFSRFDKTLSGLLLKHVLLQLYVQCKDLDPIIPLAAQSHLTSYASQVKQWLSRLEENGQLSLQFYDQHETWSDPFECEDCPSIQYKEVIQ